MADITNIQAARQERAFKYSNQHVKPLIQDSAVIDFEKGKEAVFRWRIAQDINRVVAQAEQPHMQNTNSYILSELEYDYLRAKMMQQQEAQKAQLQETPFHQKMAISFIAGAACFALATACFVHFM